MSMILGRTIRMTMPPFISMKNSKLALAMCEFASVSSSVEKQLMIIILLTMIPAGPDSMPTAVAIPRFTQ